MLMPHTTVEYYSIHGALTVGLLIGYAYLDNPTVPNAYVIDIEPRFGTAGYQLPAGKLVVIEVDRVQPSPSLAHIQLQRLAGR